MLGISFTRPLYLPTANLKKANGWLYIGTIWRYSIPFCNNIGYFEDNFNRDFSRHRQPRWAKGQQPETVLAGVRAAASCCRQVQRWGGGNRRRPFRLDVRRWWRGRCQPRKTQRRLQRRPGAKERSDAVSPRNFDSINIEPVRDLYYKTFLVASDGSVNY